MLTDTSTRASTAANREKILAIRAELPAVHERLYLNTGTNGPLPQRTHDALVAAATTELQEGRIGMATWGRIGATAVSARQRFAALLGCSTDEVALTHNTTEGMNMVLAGVRCEPDDEVVTASTEHPGGLYPVYLMKQRYGARVRMTDIALKDLDPVEELGKVLTPRTKAVVLSHVSWATGMVLPLRELADLAHSVGALLVVDAAQACGMVPSNVYDLGVDAYACSGQKWLCGPDGTGALFVRKDHLPDIQQVYLGHSGVERGMSSHEGYFVPPLATSRYEVATLYPPTVKGLVTSLEWIADEIGWDWVYARIAELGRYCYDALTAIPGVTMYSPRDRMAGLTHFALAGITPAELSAKLTEQNILIRYTPNPSANRVATGFYNTEEEIDRLAEAVDTIRKGL
jgi:L-cysteine/cystine lyase